MLSIALTKTQRIGLVTGNLGRLGGLKVLNLTAHLLKIDARMQGAKDAEIIAAFREFLDKWEAMPHGFSDGKDEKEVLL